MPYSRTVVVSKSMKTKDGADTEAGEESGEDENTSDAGMQSKKVNLGQDDLIAMSCGCLLKVIFLDFYVWKIIFIMSPSTHFQEGYGADILSPCHQTLQCEVLRMIAVMSLDTVYHIDSDGKP